MYGRPRLSYLGSDQNRTQDWRIRRIEDAMMSTGAITLNAFGQELGLSASYLSKTFKHVAGRNFRSLLLQTRHLRAAELLRETDLPVKEISARCGYKHVSDFSASFKRVYGDSPTGYRSRNHV